MVRFHSNCQIIFNCTSSIEVTTLAPLSLILTMSFFRVLRISWKKFFENRTYHYKVTCPFVLACQPENRSFLWFVPWIMVRFHSNCQIIFNCTSSIEVTTLAPLSLILTMLPSPFNVLWQKNKSTKSKAFIVICWFCERGTSSQDVLTL